MTKIEEKYQFFLTKSGLDESKLDPIEAKERRKTFMAGLTAMMVYCQDQAEPEIPEEQAVANMEAIEKELMDFWVNELTRS